VGNLGGTTVLGDPWLRWRQNDRIGLADLVGSLNLRQGWGWRVGLTSWGSIRRRPTAASVRSKTAAYDVGASDIVVDPDCGSSARTVRVRRGKDRDNGVRTLDKDSGSDSEYDGVLGIHNDEFRCGRAHRRRRSHEGTTDNRTGGAGDISVAIAALPKSTVRIILAT
jgi:hypothetical protein